MAQFADYDLRRHQTSLQNSQDSHNPATLSAYAAESFTDASNPQDLPSVLATNLARHDSNAQLANVEETGSSIPSHSNDFYSQYRQSFRARGQSGVYGLGSNAQDDAPVRNPAPTTSAVSHFQTRTNGIPSTSVTVRLNNLVKKASQEAVGKRDSTIATGKSRGRQTSLKALVNKFEQSPDEVLPLPNSRSASRSASTHTSPSTTFNPRSFRARTPSATPSEQSGAEHRMSGIERGPFDGNGLNVKKRIPKRSSQDLRTPYAGANRRLSAQFTNSSVASHSMVHLPPQVSTKNMQQPLFGEIINGEAGQGWGIPIPRVRRGSEGSMRRPTSMFRDDTDLEGNMLLGDARHGGPGYTVDSEFSRLQTRSGRLLQHQRSRSDLSDLTSSKTPLGAESSLPGRNQANLVLIERSARASKLPVRAKLSSHTFDTGVRPGARRQGQMYDLQGGNDSPQTSAGLTHELPNVHREMDMRGGSTTPRKSPRRAAPVSLHPTSPRVGAFVNDENLHEPARSPPLRSSRNRQSMAQASTTTSKSRAMQRASTVGAASQKGQTSRPLPELGGVDFAARRERIQRAFSKSVEEKEAEQRRSLILEAHRRKQEEIDIPPVPVIDHQLFADATPESGSSQKKEPADDEIFGPSPSLTLNTDAPPQILDDIRRGSVDDSPTLGALGMLPSHRTGTSSSSGRRSSVASSGTFMDDELLDGTENLSSQNDQANARPSVDGVHVILSGADRPDLGHTLEDSRWSPNSWGSLADHNMRLPSDRADGRLESIHEVGDIPDGRLRPTGELLDRTTRVEATSWSLDTGPDRPRTSNTSDVADTLANIYVAGPDAGTQLGPAIIPSGNFEIGIEKDPAMVAELSDERDSLAPGRQHDKYSQRASLVNPADFAAASPSIGDWIAHQAEDTPVEERSSQSFSDRAAQSKPQRPTGLRRPGSRPLTPAKTTSPQLPEIKTAGSDWGIVDAGRDTLQSDEAFDVGTQPYDSFGQLGRAATGPQVLVSPEQRASVSPRRGPISKYNPQIEQELSLREAPSARPQSPRPEQARHEQELNLGTESMGDARVQQVQQKSSSEEEQREREADQKRLIRRKNIIKELVDTESSFGKDMTVVVDIYKETSHVILQNPEDVRTLFGNAAEIVQFSMRFLDTLKVASNSVYKLPRSKRWRSNRDSAATADSSNGDESSSINSMDLTDDERDRLTTIGLCFEQHMTDMEKVYTDYLKNHEAASAKLLQLQKSDKVQIWLTECVSYAHDLTSAWNLDSLLVKPVQRILKYPLLLRELVEVTPENHPDFLLLDNSSREIVGLSQRINSAKKRADLVSKTTEKPTKDRKKSSEDSRNVFTKTFGRNKEKLRQQVGLGDVVQDKTYNILADKFGSHFFQVQVVMRDVEVYTVDVQKWVQRFEDFVVGIEHFMDVAQSPYPEVESKWRMFRNSVRELQATALTDHLVAVRRSVIDPMATLLKLYDGPQKMMEKRKKRILDHARWKAAQDSGAKADKKIVEQAEQFVALNETLKEELPKLFTSTKALVEACLNNFVQLQLQWTKIWRRKLTAAIDMRNPPREIQDIIDGFTSDFKFTETQVLNLGICNGALLAEDTMTFTSFSLGQNSSGTTLNGDNSSSRQTSLTYDDAREARMMINQSSSSRNRAASAHSQPVYANANVPYYPAAYAQGPSPRNRANSTASTRAREQQVWSANTSHVQTIPPQGTAPSTYRPSSQNQRISSQQSGQSLYDPSSYPRYSEDSARLSTHWYQGQQGHANGSRFSDNQYGIGAALAGASGAAAAAANPRGSAIFSSALPPSDTPPHSASMYASIYSQSLSVGSNTNHPRPSSGTQSPYNVLFLAASVYEFNIDRARREAGYPYLTYAAGEIFDVIGEKGELWLAKNQDDPSNTLGWIWNKHFAKLATDS